MIQETGIVEGLEGEYALVKAQRSGSCGSCASSSVCNPDGGGDEVVIHAINEAGAKIGDTVRIEVQTGAFIKASLLIYALPIVAMIFGAILGKYLYPHLTRFADSKDSVSAFVAFTFLIISLISVKLISSRESDAKFTPKIVGIIVENGH